MKKSILTNDLEHSIVDGAYPVELHHVFGGANRRHSDQDGLIVPLTHTQHNEPPYGVHHNYVADTFLKMWAQRCWEDKRIAEGTDPERARKEFMQRYGRSWI